MKKSTVRAVTTKNVQEEKVLARKLNYLHQSQTVASLEHDRAQTAFMKRYSALLKRKGGALSSSRGKGQSNNGAGVNFLVSGASLVKNKGQENGKIPHPAFPLTGCESGGGANSLSTAAEGQGDFQSQVRPSTTTTTVSSTLPLRAEHQRVKVPNRLASRSAPSQRYVATGLPTIGQQPKVNHWQINDNQHNTSSSIWSQENVAIVERQIRKAWSPDLRVTSYSPTQSGIPPAVAPASALPSEEAVPPPKPLPIRGILVNKYANTYPLRYSGDMLELRAELLAMNRKHSLPYGADLLTARRKSEPKKRVSFIESQIVGHEVVEDLDNYGPHHSHMAMQGLNIVTLFNDNDFVARDFTRSTPNFLF